MSSLTRRIQRSRANLGSKLGTINPKAPKPYSGKARGSRRGTGKRAGG